MGLEVGVLPVGISVTALPGAEGPDGVIAWKACTLCPLSQLSGNHSAMFSRGSKAEKVDCVCCSHTQNCAPSILSSRTLSQELKIASIRLPPNSSWWENVMAYRLSIRRSATRVIAWLAAALFFASMPILAGAAAPVQAQVAVKADFRTALEPHGTWRNSSRWGEVWVPSNRPRDWQPYTAVIGSSRMTGAGIGSKISPRPSGASSPITTAAGSWKTTSGFGCQARNGVRAG